MAAQTICGVAAFVKTPGLTPLKTRLAASLSRAGADQFYQQACDCVLAMLQATPNITPYWAVAEAAGHKQWSSLPTLSQGEGDLGQRLATVWQELHARHGRAMVIGTDCPQMTPPVLTSALALLEKQDYVAGPARDGGFYLLASRHPIAPAIWQDVTYSTGNTWAELKSRLISEGSVVELPVLTDVDEAQDLQSLARELATITNLSPAQAEMQKWLAQL